MNTTRTPEENPSYDDALALALPWARETQRRIWLVETRDNGWLVAFSTPLLPYRQVFVVDEQGQVSRMA
jgi:hypothetical protein